MLKGVISKTINLHCKWFVSNCIVSFHIFLDECYLEHRENKIDRISLLLYASWNVCVTKEICEDQEKLMFSSGIYMYGSWVLFTLYTWKKDNFSRRVVLSSVMQHKIVHQLLRDFIAYFFCHFIFHKSISIKSSWLNVI